MLQSRNRPYLHACARTVLSLSLYVLSFASALSPTSFTPTASQPIVTPLPLAITAERSSVTANEGDDVILTCHAEGSQQTTVEWDYNMVFLDYLLDAVSEGRVTVRNSTRLLTGGARVNITSSIAISNVQRCDSGLFSCCTELQCADVTLNVQSPVRMLSVPLSVSALENSSVTLQCGATAKPTPSPLIWTGPNGPIGGVTTKGGTVNGQYADISSNLTITFLHVNDSGNYACFAYNPLTYNRSIIRLTVKGPPGKCSGPSVTSAVGDSVEVSVSNCPINGNASVTKFKILYKTLGSSNPWSEVVEMSLPVNITGLIPYTEYEVRVAAGNQYGYGPNSNPRIIRTTQGEPGPPGNVSAIALGPRRVGIKWSKPINPFGPINDYRIFYSDANNVNSFLISASRKEVILPGLSPYTNYRISITAINIRDGDGKFLLGTRSNEVIVQTDEDAPSAPRNLSSTPLTPNSAKIQWSPPEPANGRIRNYTLVYTKAGETIGNRTITVSGDSLSVNLNNLNTAVKYNVKIRAVTVLPGPYESITVETKPDSQSKVPFNCRKPLPNWNGNCNQVAKPGRTATILDVTPNIISGNSRLHSGFEIYWNGWTCLSPCTLTYNWAVYPLEPVAGSAVKAVHPARGHVLRHATHEQPVPTPISFSHYNPPYTLLMIEMNATSTNGTTTVARTLVLADDDSRVDVAKGSKISFRSTFDDAWLTKDDERDSVVVEWTSDHFFNTYIRTNPWLLYRVDVPRPTYDTSASPLSFSGVASANDVGVTSFRAWLRKKEIDGWSIVDNDVFLQLSARQWSVPLSLSNGETYQVEIEAEDIFGHAINDTFTVYTDYVLPTIGNVSVWNRNNRLPISDTSFCMNRSQAGLLSLEVNAVDAESGVKEVIVSIAGLSPVTINAQHPDKCSGDSCTCALNEKCVLNDFTTVIKSSATSFSRIDVEATSYSGLTMNRRFNGVIVQKGGNSPTDLTIQSTGTDSLSVSWKYSGADVRMFSVIACRRPSNQNKCVCTPKFDVVGTPPPKFVTVTGLNPFSEYAVQVEAITISGSSGLSDYVKGNTKEGTPDGPPLNVFGEGRFTPELGAHMIVRWKPPQLEHRNGIITDYYVNVYLGGLLARGEEKFNSSTRNTIIPNVRSGREYAVTVTAATKVGRGVPSVRVIVKTPDGTPSVPPGSVSTAAIHKDNITIRWNSIPEDSRNGRLNYVVFYRPQNDAVNEKRITVPGNVLSATIDGLLAFTDYLISVAGETTKGIGPKSEEFTIQTDEDVPGPPNINRVDSIGTTALGVSWSPPSDPRGKITQYRIVVTSAPTGRRRRAAAADSSSFMIFANEDETFKVVGGLESGKAYSVAMDARTSKGWGVRQQHRTTVQTQPKIVGAPEGLEATRVIKINSTALLIRWQNVSANNVTVPPKFYTISYKEEAGSDASKEARVDGSKTEYEIQRLTPYTYYRIIVAANGNPNKSSTVFAWTPEGKPGKLSYFLIPPESVDDASALLEWKPPEKPNGRISYAFTYWSLVTGRNEAKPPVILRPDELRLVAGNRYRWRVSDLVGLTEYRFVMWAYNLRNPNWTGPESDPVGIRTDPGRPGPPSAFDVRAEDDGTLAVFWGPPQRPNGEILGYEVATEWANETGSPATLTTIHRTARSERFQLVTGLEKPALYKVSLRAYNGEGLGIPSETTRRTRLTRVDDRAPRNVTLHNSTHDSITVTWERPKAVTPVSYYVNVLQDGTSFRQSVPVPRGTRALVDGLHSFTLFYAVVVASFSDGTNESSSRRYFQTNSSAPSCPPRNFAIKATNSTRLRLEWVSPLSVGTRDGVACSLNGVLGGFHVSYQAANESGGTELIARIVPPEEHHFIASLLEPYTFYRASVAAITYGAREKGPSATETARTSEGVPDALDVSGYETTANSVTLSWIVSKANGVLKWVRIDIFRIIVVGQLSWEGTKTILKKERDSTSFHDLMAYTFYEVIAVAASGAGEGLERIIRIQTNESVPDAAPTILGCTALHDGGDDSVFDSFKLNFTTIPSDHWHGEPGNYRVYVQGKAAKETIKNDDPMHNVETTVTALENLETGVEHNVTVVAYTEHGGEGPASNSCILFRPLREQATRKESSSDVAVGLGVFFPLLIVALVIVIVFFYWRKRARAKEYAISQPGLEMTEGNRYVDRNHWLNDWPKYDDFQFDRSRLEIGKELGEGQFGKVYLAVAKNLLEGEEETRVAVKTVKGGASRETADDFRKEIEIMMDFDHPNVIALLGVCTREEPLYLITELMKHGDLKEFVRAARASEERVRPLLSLEQLLDAASQAVAGVAHLASRKFVHRDIAARNCLVGGDDVGDEAKYVVKIADFGMAKDVYVGDYYRKKGGALPIRWMAPEAIMDGKYTIESDTWSTGVLLWEIFSFGFQPYFGQENEKVLGGIISGSLVLPCPPVTPDAVYKLMLRCWERLPGDRIPTSVVEDELKKMLVACRSSGVGAVYSYAMNDDYMVPLQSTVPPPPAAAMATKQMSYVDMTDTMKKAAKRKGNEYSSENDHPPATKQLSYVDMTDTLKKREENKYTPPETKPMSSSDRQKKVTSYVDMAGVVALGGDDDEEPRSQGRAVPNQYDFLSGGNQGGNQSSDAAKLPKMDSYVDMGTGDTSVLGSPPPLAAIPESSGSAENAYVDMGENDSSPKGSDGGTKKPALAAAEKDEGGKALVNPLYDLVLTGDVPET